MAKMKLPSKTTILLNGAAILIGCASLAAVVRSMLVANDVPSCRERYGSATRLALDRDGKALAAADLQARVGSSDWGLLEGARVVRLRSGPARHALEIDLAVAVQPNSDGEPGRPGVGFLWSPQSLGSVQAACLSYGVFLPEGFTFGRGGRLPGIAGAPREQAESEAPAFSTRYMWGSSGEGDIHTHLPDWPEGRPLSNNFSSFRLVAGQWSQLEQEVVLNTPGRADGILRVWQDGRLVMNRKDVTFRKDEATAITGVLAEAMSAEPATAKVAGPRKIWLTPFELRWQ